MEGVLSSALRIFLIIFASLGTIFHLLLLKRPEKGRKTEERLGAEFGCKKRFLPWLENSRMALQERLMRSKAYNICVLIFLIGLLILLFQM